MSREGDYYVLKSYEVVWKLLGIQKVNIAGGKRYRFHKISDHSTWSIFKRKTIEDIQGYQTERKKAHFKRRLNYAGMSPDVNHSPLFSAKAAAKLFGYKSRTSGSRYRERYFDVIKEPLKLRLKYTSDLLPYFQFDCKRVSLKNIYHEG